MSDGSLTGKTTATGRGSMKEEVSVHKAAQLTKALEQVGVAEGMKMIESSSGRSPLRCYWKCHVHYAR
jgi:hypothetical protein